MNIVQLKEHLCDLIQGAYDTALEEGHQEIVHPFRIDVHPDGSVDYEPLTGRHSSKERKGNLSYG